MSSDDVVRTPSYCPLPHSVAEYYGNYYVHPHWTIKQGGRLRLENRFFSKCEVAHLTSLVLEAEEAEAARLANRTGVTRTARVSYACDCVATTASLSYKLSVPLAFKHICTLRATI